MSAWARGHWSLIARAGRGAAAGRRRGPTRPPTGWTGCTSATTCPGRRSTLRWPGARWWRARSPSTPTAAGPEGKRLAALADAAEQAPRAGREAAENELSAALALVDPASLPVALVAELADAEARVLLARRFHNDAVRDTLALRERRAVRWLRLGGTAALPTYFEIAERADRDVGRGQPAHVGAGGAARRRRRGAAVLRVRPGDRPTAPRHAGGSPSAARPSRGRRWPRPRCASWPRRPACASSRPTWSGPVWRRDAVIDFNGSVIRSEEMFFVHRTGRFEPSAAGPHRAGTALHPRPPLVRCDNDRRAGRQGRDRVPAAARRAARRGERAGRRRGVRARNGSCNSIR